MNNHLYNIYNAITGAWIAKQITSNTAHELIGIRKEKVCMYAEKGLKYKRVYLITTNDYINVDVKKDIPESMWKEFEEQSKYLKTIASPERLRKIVFKRVNA
jgi:hypothetical protein